MEKLWNYLYQSKINTISYKSHLIQQMIKVLIKYKSLAGMENATCGKHLSLTPKKARFLHFAKRKHEVFYEFW